MPGVDSNHYSVDPKSTALPVKLPGNRARDRNRTDDRQFTKLLLYQLSYSGNLHIILFPPGLVNGGSGTNSLGPIVHSCIPMFSVARADFPRLLDFDLDFVVVASWTSIVVEVVHFHTIIHLRVCRKPYLS